MIILSSDNSWFRDKTRKTVQWSQLGLVGHSIHNGRTGWTVVTVCLLPSGVQTDCHKGYQRVVSPESTSRSRCLFERISWVNSHLPGGVGVNSRGDSVMEQIKISIVNYKDFKNKSYIIDK